MTPTQKTAILVARVSTPEQKRRQTIQAQLPVIRELAESRGLKVLEVILDDGHKSWRLPPRQLHRVCLEIATGLRPAPDYFVCTNPDRLFRVKRSSPESRQEGAWFEGVLYDHKIKILSTGGELDPQNTVVFAVQNALGSEELRMRSQRVDSSRRERLAAGRPIWGRVPYGYRKDWIDTDRHSAGYVVAIDPVRSERFLRLVGWVIEGGVAHACRKATEARIPRPDDLEGNPGDWDTAHLHRMMLLASQYLGAIRYEYRGTEGEIRAPAILDHGTYARLRAAMAVRSKRHGVAVYLTTGTVLCAACGHQPSVSTPGGKRTYLQCRYCRKSARYDEAFERWLWATVRVRAHRIEAHEGAAAEESSGVDAALAAAQAELGKLQRRIDKVLALHLDDAIDDDSFHRQHDPMLDRKRELQAEAKRLEQARIERASQVTAEKSYLERISEAMSRMRQATAPAERNTLLRDLLAGRRIRVHFGEPFQVTYPEHAGLAPWTVSRSPDGTVRFAEAIEPDGTIEVLVTCISDTSA